MNDVFCENCKEPWDAWHVTFDEDLPFDPLETIEVDDWEITWGADQDAAATGELLIHHCPCCKSNQK